MSVRIPLDSMTVDEKLSVMEEIWADLSRKPDNIPKRGSGSREARLTRYVDRNGETYWLIQRT